MKTPTKLIATPPAPPASEWRLHVERGLDRLKHADRYLVPPPSQTPVAHLRDVQVAVDENSGVPGQLMAFGAMAPVLWNRHGDKQTIGQLRLATAAAAEAAARRVTPGTMEEELEEFLRTLDKVIATRLDQGDRSAPLVRTADFGKDGLRCVWVTGLDAWIQAGAVKGLPADHPIREWPAELLYEADGREPVAILGQTLPAFSVTRPGSPRPFYSIDHAWMLTKQLRLRQAQERLKQANVSPVDYAAAHKLLEEVGRKLPPIRRPEPPQPEPPAPVWRDAVMDVLKVHEKPKYFFVRPTADVTVRDMLAIRSACGVLDDDSDQPKDAAQRLAARYGGQSRRAELVEWLTPLLSATQRQLVVAIEKAWLHGAAAVQKAEGGQ